MNFYWRTRFTLYTRIIVAHLFKCVFGMTTLTFGIVVNFLLR